MDSRIILHLDMDAFFAAIEERENPHFRGKPVVVGADPKGGKGRGVVSTANYEARKYGIRSALPISQAYRLCPEAIFLPVNGTLYAEVSERVMEIIRTRVPLIEQVSLDEAYGDVTFLGTFDRALGLAKELKREIAKREQLACTCGIGPNKMAAKIACEQAKPDGLLAVLPDDVPSFLAPLPARKIPGIGEKTLAMLERQLKKSNPSVADLRTIDPHQLESLFGKRGTAMQDAIWGKDESPVVADEEAKSIGKEHTFEEDTTDPEEIHEAFQELLADAWEELEGRTAKTVTVICRFQGFETHTKAKTLDYPLSSFEEFRREATVLLLKFLTEYGRPVRLVGVRLKIAQRTLL